MKLFRPEDGWRAFTPQQLKELGIWPNKLYYNVNTGESVLVVQQSPTWSEYALSQAGLIYLLTALKEGRLTRGYVVLTNRDHEEVARKPVSEVATLVENLPPRKDELGPYWWLNADLTPFDASKAPF
jgi:hypothetical protein